MGPSYEECELCMIIRRLSQPCYIDGWHSVVDSFAACNPVLIPEFVV
jgi:hypothetical protein